MHALNISKKKQFYLSCNYTLSFSRVSPIPHTEIWGESLDSVSQAPDNFEKPDKKILNYRINSVYVKLILTLEPNIWLTKNIYLTEAYLEPCQTSNLWRILPKWLLNFETHQLQFLTGFSVRLCQGLNILEKF